MRILKGLVLTSAVIGFATSAYALEYPIGEPQFGGGMEVAAVYLQPIEMEPAGMMLAADKADIHLEADIHATKDNVNGFANGATNLLLNGGSITGGNSSDVRGALYLYNGNEQITAGGATTSTIAAVASRPCWGCLERCKA